jgi:hypothetical protein
MYSRHRPGDAAETSQQADAHTAQTSDDAGPPMGDFSSVAELFERIETRKQSSGQDQGSCGEGPS